MKTSGKLGYKENYITITIKRILILDNKMNIKRQIKNLTSMFGQVWKCCIPGDFKLVKCIANITIVIHVPVGN